MKIAITSRGASLEDETDTRFGRCAYFALHDTETEETEFVENTAAEGAGGVGPLASRLIADKGARVLITGNVGPNAHDTLAAFDIRVYAHDGGTVKETIERYGKGVLKEIVSPSVGSHAGMGGGRS